MDITCKAFSELDEEIKQEFYQDVEAAVADINECAIELEQSNDDNIIDRMFRAIHTVKGNCNMVFLAEFVDATHCLEELFSAIREKNIDYHSSYGHFSIHIVNLVLSQLRLLIETGTADGSILANIKMLIDQVLQTNNDERLAVVKKAILAIDEEHFNISLIIQDSEDGKAFSYTSATDSEFFEYVSNQHQQNPRRQKFFNICTVLADKLNNMLSNSADEQQLHSAIIFLHLSQGATDDGNIAEVNLPQCIMASGFLKRMSGWSDAADLCLQVMECHDGSGSPNGLKNSEIMPAAQVLTIAFEFAHQVLLCPSAEYKPALFSAVKFINSKKDKRYKDRLIQRFNQVIKSDYLTQQMF